MLLLNPVGLVARWFSGYPRLRGGLLAVLMTGGLVALYWVGLHGSFLFDDEANILLVEGIKIQNLSFQSLTLAAGSGHSGPLGRVIAQLSFALNHYFSGFNPFAFKATNLAIHAVNGLLIYLLVGHLMVDARWPATEARWPMLPATMVAVFWLFHPIQLVSVLLVVQRMTSLSALFLLLAFILHLRARQGYARHPMLNLLLAWCVLWPLAALSKESGLLFPFFILAWELTLRRTTAGRLDWPARLLVGVLGVGVGIAAAYAFSARGSWLWVGYEFRSFSPLERMLTEGRVLWFYISLIITPTLERLALHHDYFIVSRGLVSPWTTALSWAGLLMMFGLAWWARLRSPFVAFGFLWFLIGHSMESTVLPLEIAYEHRNYLPSLGILLVLSAGLRRLLNHPGVGRTLALTTLAALLLNILLVTGLRSHQFGDEVRRVQLEVQHHPESVRAHYDAGQMFLRIAENVDQASPAAGFAHHHFVRAMETDPTFKLAGLGLLVLECRAAGKVSERWLPELLLRLRNTPLQPGETAFFYGLKELSLAGRLCLVRSEIDDLFAAALNHPTITRSAMAALHSWHADYLWLGQHDLPAAKAALIKSLEMLPSNRSNQLKWAQLLYLGGDLRAAGELLRGLDESHLSPVERNLRTELLALTLP